VKRAGAILVFLVVTAQPTSAAIYRWVDESGIVHYSDRVPDAAVPPPGPPSPSWRVRDVPPPAHPADVVPPRPAQPGPASVGGATRGRKLPPASRPLRPAGPAPGHPAPPSVPPAADPRGSSSRSSQIHELMDRMHVGHEAEQMARYARQALFEQRLRSASAGMTWAAVNGAFAAVALAGTIEERLTGALEGSPTLPQILAWLRSPLGRRVMDLATPAETPAREAAFRRFAVAAPEALAHDRIRLVREFGRTSDFVPLLRDRMAATDGVMSDLAARSRSMGVLGLALRRTVVADTWANDHLRWRVQMTLLFDFRELSDAELREAIAFWTDPVGLTLVRAYREAVLDAIAIAHQRAGGVLQAAATSTPTR